jgi:hypothetical protein
VRKTFREGISAGLIAGAVSGLPSGRRVPRIRELPLVPQLVDHVAYGAVVGAVLGRRRR